MGVMGVVGGVMLAHQGGWDEILFILGPIAVVVLLLRLAKRRVDRMTPPDAPTSSGDRAADAGHSQVSPADDARSKRPPT